MISAYKKSLYTCWGVRAAAVLIIGFLWIHDLKRGYPIYIPVVATVLMLAVGYFLSRLLGNLTASVENTKRLGFLHMELDPQKFIDSYKGVLDRIKKGTRDHAVAASYLADGYLAAGDPETALGILDEGFAGVPDLESAEKPALSGLYHSGRLACLLDMHELAEAKEEAAKLEKVISVSLVSNKALAGNLKPVLELRKARINIAEGKAADQNRLKSLLSGAQFNLRRLEICRAAAENALFRHDRKTAEEYLNKLEKEGGKTCFARYAAEIRARYGND